MSVIVIRQKQLIVMFIALIIALNAQGQGFKRLFEDGSFSGQIQTEVQYCFKDSAGDKSEYVNRFLSNTYIDAAYNSRMLSAGVRFEMYENPLPGFEPEFKGIGVPNFYLTLRLKNIAITGGDFYEQFGSGLILRTYQERSLGIDNALRGGRIVYEPFSWMRLKVLSGIQRNRWVWSDTWINGADMELDIDKWFPAMANHNQRLQLGGSFVTKHEQDEIILASPGKRLNLPSNVGAFSVRLKYQAKNITLQSEYAWKANDPSSDNGYIYRPGQALLLSASYFRQGFGISLAAKHCDNMAFRSERTGVGTALQINYLPAFSRQHSYALAALYPYATQANGEVAFQGDVFYKFKKGTTIGGAYGMDIRLNYSQIYSLKKEYNSGLDKPSPGTYGYKTSFFSIGDELYYRDINLEVSRRVSSSVKLTAMYMNQAYNQIVRGESGMIYSNIVVGEVQYKINRKFSLRGELQYLATQQDEKDWMSALLELSISPHWMITLSDLYNVGGTRDNYPMASVAYSTGAHRIQLSGGKQRAGYNCAGGICRYVPATTGFGLSYTANF